MIVENHRRNPNNLGTMTAAGRAAIAVYLRDADELSSVARVFRGFLHRQGYDSYGWGDRALLRAVRLLHRLSLRDPIWWKGARGPHGWEPWLVNHRYGTSFPATGPTALGKNMGWTDWTHARRATDR